MLLKVNELNRVSAGIGMQAMMCPGPENMSFDAMTSVDHLSRIISLIYEAAVGGSEEWNTALLNLSDLFGGWTANAALVDVRTFAGQWDAVRIDLASFESYAQYYGALNPVNHALTTLPTGSVYFDYTTTPQNEMIMSEFYNDWARPNDLGGCMGVLALREDSKLGLVCISRPLHKPDFDEGYRAAMELLAPHLKLAMQVRQRLATSRSECALACSALDQLSHGVMLLSPSGALQFSNAAMKDILEQRDGLQIVQGGLIIASTPATTRTIRRMIEKALTVGKGSSTALGRPTGKQDLHVLIMPISAALSERVQASAGAIMFVTDPECVVLQSAECLREIFGLTAAEAIVAQEIGTGAGVKQVARRLAVSETTVRTHLQKVFVKTGTDRQARLTKLLASLGVVRSVA
jgi:DNA-binding CsgD family transcriptional regulator